MNNLRFRSSVWAAVLLCAGAAFPAWATNRQVNNLNDSGTFSLRYWIANAVPGDTIVFSNGLSGTIVLTNGELVIAQGLSISGPGATNLAVSGNASSRVFNIQSGVTAIISGLTITNGRTAGTNGASSSCNGGTHIFAAAGSSGTGGALFNTGNLTLSNCVLTSNMVIGGNGGDETVVDCNGNVFFYGGAAGGNARGGAIFNGGNLSLFGCALVNNSASGGAGGAGAPGYSAFPWEGSAGGRGGSGFGGGVYSTGIVAVVNCTFAGNHVSGGNGGMGGDADQGPVIANGGNGGNGGDGNGAAIAISNTGNVSITNCTISGNGALGGDGGGGGRHGGNGGSDGSTGTSGLLSGGIYVSASGLATLKNSIIALNTGSTPDVSGYFTSMGFNFIGITNSSSGWTASDLKGTAISPRDPALGPVQANGGPTPTMALLTGSAAIDYGNSSGIAIDQRGVARPNDLSDYSNNPNGGDGSDIGAYEYQTGAGGLDIGLRLFDGMTTNKIAGEYPAVSPLRLSKNGTNYGIVLTATNAPDASKFRIQTASGVKALQKLP